MKKKSAWPVFLLCFIMTMLMLITIVDIYSAGKQAISSSTAAGETHENNGKQESSDLMIWESVSHHLIPFSY